MNSLGVADNSPHTSEDNEMHKSKAHFKVIHNGIETLVPVSYIAIIQSRDFGTTEEQAVRLALNEVSMIAVAMGDDCEFKYDKGPLTPVYNEEGNEIPPDTFTVVEHHSGFELIHNPTGKTHWLSDGVDAIGFDEGYGDDEEPVTLSPGVLGFVELWTEDMNNSESETLEAYFPELVDE
jgi:hypothetical protein